MKIKIIDFIQEQKKYIEDYCEDKALELWKSLVLDKKWQDLCCYSPINLDERKPQAILDIENLKKQTELMEKIDFAKLQNAFDKIVSVLPNYDDDQITVGIIASDPQNETVNTQQNGVVGTSLFGNILIQVNPLIPDFEKWIEYVFAHEYHHTVWGNYWFNLHGNELKNDLLQALVIDGQADSFACKMCPTLKPKWLYLDAQNDVIKLYETFYKQNLQSTDFDYVSLIFGDESKNIPWCAGYAVGYYLIQKYLQNTKKDFLELIETPFTVDELR